jgi:hypothetical protein
MAVGSASSMAGRISLRGGVLAYDSMEAGLYAHPNYTPRLSHERHGINAAVLLMAQGSGLYSYLRAIRGSIRVALRAGT